MNENNPGERLERQRAFLTRFCYWAVLVALTYLAVKYALPVLLPFVIAGVIACLLNKPIGFLAARTRLQRNYLCAPVVLLFFLLVGTLLFFFGGTVIASIKEIAAALPSFFSDVAAPFLESAAERVEALWADILPGMENVDAALLETLSKGIEAVSSALMNALGGIAAKVPSLFLKTIITVIATFFMTGDFEKIRAFLAQHIPADKWPILREARDFFGGTLAKCLGAYLLIMGITFLELLLGLALLQVPHAAILALLIAIVDILPVLGTGTVLIPWALLALIGERYALGVGLLLLYLMITIIRNTIEPKLVGKQMGLHPLVTLAGMLLGLKYFGFVGMLGFPLSFAFVNYLSKKRSASSAPS